MIDREESTAPVWWDGLPEEAAAAEPLPDRHEVVVVGGGLTGISAALWLCRYKMIPLLLEQSGPGSGATGRSAGFLIPGTIEHFARAVSKFGLEAALSLWDFTVENHHLLRHEIREAGIDCDLGGEGFLALGRSRVEQEEIRQSVGLMQQHGLPAELWEREEIEARLPGLSSAHPFDCGRYDLTGRAVNPARMIRGLARRAESEGAVFRYGVRVREVNIRPDGDLDVITDQGSVRAVVVILAINGLLSQLVKGLEETLTPARGQILATTPVEAMIPFTVSTNFGYDYWRQDASGRLILGGARWRREDLDLGVIETVVSRDVQTQLDRMIRRTLSGLGKVEVSHRWAGTMAFTSDGLPLIGPLPGRPNILVAGGYNSHGLAFGFLAGRLLAELLYKGKPSRPLDLFAPRRFL